MTPAPPDVLDHSLTRRLLETVVRLGDTVQLASERRERFIEALIELTGSDAGHWAWGRGRPPASGIVTLAVLPLGYTPDQLTAMHELSQDPVYDQEVRSRLMGRIGLDGQVCVTNDDVFADGTWEQSGTFAYYRRVGLFAWLNAIRYTTDDTWVNLHLIRSVGKEKFSPRERSLIGLALASVSWLYPAVSERVPLEDIAELTPRQRLVLTLLLDGLSRKQIARRLELTENTVGDHIKTIYQHFGVHSVAALAAQFLKNQ